MSTTPKISVIIPIYNDEKYLAECLDSVTQQTFSDIEIICINDASTDASPEILTQYATNDSRIKIINYTENRSASQARKDGVLASSGKYIMFMDADDSIELVTCEELLAAMEKYHVDILQFGTYVDAEENISKNSVSAFNHFVTPCMEYLSGRKVFEGCFEDRKYRFNLWNKIYKSDLCKKAFSEIEDGLFPKAQDLYAYFIISWYAQSYQGMKKKYYHYNYGRGITGGAKMLDSTSLERYCSQDKVAQKCKEFLLQQNAWEQYKELWSRLNRDLISECVNVWLNNFNESSASEGFDILADHWGIVPLRETVVKNFNSQIQLIEQKCQNAKCLQGMSLMGYFDASSLFAQSDCEPPIGFETVIPIVFATNDNYSIYAAIAIESILKNAHTSNFYRIYILYDQLTDDHLNILETITSSQATIKCIKVSELIERKEAVLYEKAHFTKEMYYRFIIPELFNIYDKVIYLDCDLVVTTDIADILPQFQDIEDNLIAAVRNPVTQSSAKRISRDLNIDPMNYINSGVLIINVKQWRDEKTVDKCFNLLKTIPRAKLIYCDQDILNIVCENRILYLDPCWNYLWHMRYGSPDFIEVSRPIVERVGNNFIILHFASNIKPWMRPDIPLSKFFWKYARCSNVYEEVLFKNIGKIAGNIGEKDQPKRHIDELYNLPKKDLIIKIQDLEKRLSFANKEIIDIRHSWTYRIGRFITWIPRKIRGGIRCYYENGWSYTLDRLLVHLHLKYNPCGRR